MIDGEAGPLVPVLVFLVLGATGFGDPAGFRGPEGVVVFVETSPVEVLIVTLIDEIPRLDSPQELPWFLGRPGGRCKGILRS
jgi:hypothetical protein